MKPCRCWTKPSSAWPGRRSAPRGNRRGSCRATSRGAFFCGEQAPPFCGAGFTPADGAATHAKTAAPPALAGINPAPQFSPHRANPAAASAGTSCLLFCGAGFMPADGAATHAEAAAPPALAGINPAPQVLTPPGQSAAAAAGTSCLLFCGAGFMPADGAATHAKAAAPPALAGINPAPQVLTPPGQSAAAAAGT